MKVIKDDKRGLINRHKYAIAILSLLIIILSFVGPFIILPLKSNNIYIPGKVIISKRAALQLNKEPSKLANDDFDKITELDLSFSRFSDIKYLEKFKNLKKLNLNGIHFAYRYSSTPKWKQMLSKIGIDLPKEKVKAKAINLSSLKTLTNLENLSIGENAYVRNIKTLSTLKNLKKLSFLNSNRLTELKQIGKIKNLEELDLKCTYVSDLNPIKTLLKLRDLVLSGTEVSNIEPLKNLTNLELLDLQATDVSNLEPIRALTNLKSLNISYTSVSDLEPIRKLSNLKKADFNHTSITNLEPIKELTNIEILNLFHTKIVDIEPYR